MTSRSVRRAAERKAKKQARKAERLSATADPNPDSQPGTPVDDAPLAEQESNLDVIAAPAMTKPISAAQLVANRANAQLSCGPVTREGRAAIRLNAVKTGLTGRTVLLPSDDADEYKEHMRAYQAELAPVGQRETDLARSIAETAWRLRRIPQLECGIHALGVARFREELQEHHHPAVASHLIQTLTQLHYEKELRNLHLQESRLVRRREKEVAELRALQQERARHEEEHAAKASHGRRQPQPPAPVTAPAPVPTAPQPATTEELTQNGFEFSSAREISRSRRSRMTGSPNQAGSRSSGHNQPLPGSGRFRWFTSERRYSGTPVTPTARHLSKLGSVRPDCRPQGLS